MIAQLSADKPTLKILLYTDDTDMDFDAPFLGLGEMVKRLHAHAPTFANLETTLVCRNRNQNADHKLDDVLNREAQTGKPFDEIWFFGLKQANTQQQLFSNSHGGPHNTLDAGEIAVLEQWMSARNGGHGGGVLMTGDHSNPAPPTLLEANLNSFIGLGRAIGHSVPRAGALRSWEGPPTRQAADSFSTIASFGSQGDRFPQYLTLRNVNLDGDRDDQGQPHPLFFYNQDEYISVFPDHHHEGAVVLPEVFDLQEWPNGPNGQVLPQVVALGIDKRRQKQLNVIATYNGDLANVGRIVADSTWHHYANANLEGFQHPAPVGTHSDRIGQFYGNLALWLAPLSKRKAMARAMNWQLARYTLLLEGTGYPEYTGKVASALINRVASPCEVHELLRVLPPSQAPALEAAALAGDVAASARLFLGHVIEGYHREMLRESAPQDDVALEAAPTTIDGLIEMAYRNALQEQETRLRDSLAALTSLHNND